MTQADTLKAPFPYFGGKRTVAAEVWRRLGNVDNYLEPFSGSAAVLLARPDSHEWWDKTETINDKGGFVANAWRALQVQPAKVAKYADWPMNENDLHARHAWLVGQRDSLTAQLEGNPDYYDAKIAGWWIWGMSCWIGGGFCSGNGPWQVQDGKLVNLSNDGQGVSRRLVHLSNDGMGVTRQIVHLSNDGQGVNRKLVAEGIYEWFERLQERVRRVRVCSGDWSRILGPAVLRCDDMASVGVFLDQPYSADQGRDMGVYSVDDGSVAHDVRKWAVEWGKHPKLRIALCGYEGIDMPSDWLVYEWKAAGGYGSQGEGTGRENAYRERIWFSPACRASEGVQANLL